MSVDALTRIDKPLPSLRYPFDSEAKLSIETARMPRMATSGGSVRLRDTWNFSPDFAPRTTTRVPFRIFASSPRSATFPINTSPAGLRWRVPTS